MKKLALALALTVMGAAGASAQGIEFRLGPDADRYERSRERVIVRDRRDRDWDDDRMVRRRDVVTTGSTCRTTVVYRENERGRGSSAPSANAIRRIAPSSKVTKRPAHAGLFRFQRASS